MTAASDPPPLGPGEIDMNEIARLVRAADIPAFVAHVGGGGAVVYAGSPGSVDPGDQRYPAAAGPGRLIPDPIAGWEVIHARGRLDDFYFGPDDGGEGDVESRTAIELGVTTALQTAAVLVVQTLVGERDPGRCLTPAEGRAAAHAARR